jgi:solute carrier family 25 folate transporter 32
MEQRKVAPWIHSVSALGGALISTGVTHPLDLVKARFQVQHVNKQLGGKIVYRSTLQAFRVILKEEGFVGLYRGVVPNLFGNGAAWALYMLFYSWLKDVVGGPDSSSEVSFKSLGLAGLAGAGTAVITNPIWLVKVRKKKKRVLFFCFVLKGSVSISTSRCA